MLTPPADLGEEVLSETLARGWEVEVASMTYRPVGFGSHHWEVVDAGGTRWFVTADELETGPGPRRGPQPTALDRLRASLAAAQALRDHGRKFVVAPVPTRAGEPLARAGERLAVALYPFVDGRSYEWGERLTPAHGHALLDLIVAVHTAPNTVRRHAMADDFAVPYRDELVATLDPAGGVGDCGPYARPTSGLLTENAAPIQRLLARYDALVAAGRAQPSRTVLTHGEPHPGNTIRTADGWLLIDWDTALVAPPERDLWIMDPGDGSILSAYADATGVTPLPSMLDLYRIRWDLADIAVAVRRFRRRHAGSLDDDKSWEILRSLVAHLSG